MWTVIRFPKADLERKYIKATSVANRIEKPFWPAPVNTVVNYENPL